MRLLSAHYSDGVFQIEGLHQPNARRISNTVSRGPSGHLSVQNRTVLSLFFGEWHLPCTHINLLWHTVYTDKSWIFFTKALSTVIFWQHKWLLGFHVVHEVAESQRPGCPAEFMQVLIPKDDLVFGNNSTEEVLFQFQRVQWDHSSGQSPNNPRKQVTLHVETPKHTVYCSFCNCFSAVTGQQAFRWITDPRVHFHTGEPRDSLDWWQLNLRHVQFLVWCPKEFPWRAFVCRLSFHAEADS